MADFLINSSNIEVYPTTKRSVDFDQKNRSKLNFEPNISGLLSNITDYYSYIVSGLTVQEDTDNIGKFILKSGKCVINGYNIEIKEDITNISISNNHYLYMYIEVDENGLVGSDNNNKYNSIILDTTSNPIIADKYYLLLAFIDNNSNIELIESGKYNLDNISIEEKNSSISDVTTKQLFTNWLLDSGFIINDEFITSNQANNQVVIIYNDGTYLKLNSSKTTLTKIDLINKDNILSLYIPTSIVSIENGLLEGCTSLKYLTIPFIGTSSNNPQTLIQLFNTDSINNIYLKYINILSVKQYSALEIINDTFNSSTTLEKILLPANLVGIGSRAFYGCINLKEIEIPENCLTIGSSCFENCTSLKKVKLDYNIQNANSTILFYNDAFKNVNLNESLDIPNAGLYVKHENILNNITFSNMYSNPMYGGSYLYVNGVKIELLKLTSSYITPISNIRDYAYCGLCADTLILNKINKIGKSAFYSSNIKNIQWISEYSINSQNSLYIDDYAFNGCSELESFEFISANSIYPSQSLERVGTGAFSDCIKLSCITLPRSNSLLSTPTETIGSCAFSNCTSLKYVFINTSVNGAIPALEVNGGVYDSFKDTTCFIYISEMPNNSIIANNWATYGWNTYINRIIVTPCKIEYNSNLYYLPLSTPLTYQTVFDAISTATGLSSLEIDERLLTKLKVGAGISPSGSSITHINQDTFIRFNNLQELTFYDNCVLTYIGENAFEGTALTGTIKLPDSLIEIKAGAFYQCVYLNSVEISQNITKIGATAFEGCTALSSVYFVNKEFIWTYKYGNIYTVFDGSTQAYTLTNENAALYLKDTYSDADWISKSTSYTLDFIDLTTVESRTVYNGVGIVYNNLSLPVLPDRYGYRFDGWYIDNQAEPINDTTVYNYTENKTAYAIWTELILPTPQIELYNAGDNVIGVGKDYLKITNTSNLTINYTIYVNNGSRTTIYTHPLTTSFSESYIYLPYYITKAGTYTIYIEARPHVSSNYKPSLSSNSISWTRDGDNEVWVFDENISTSSIVTYNYPEDIDNYSKVCFFTTDPTASVDYYETVAAYSAAESYIYIGKLRYTDGAWEGGIRTVTFLKSVSLSSVGSNFYNWLIRYAHKQT